MAIIPKPKFPNIPPLPGVPQLLRSAVFAAAPPAVLLAATAIGKLLGAFDSKFSWGVFDPITGEMVVNPDSVVDFGYRNTQTISSFPVERGNFAAYNKVSSPFEATVRMTKGGSEDDRARFLANLTDIVNDAKPRANAMTLPLYTIMTPERSYTNVSLERYEVVRRGASGAHFIDADLYFKQIRQITPEFTSTAAGTQNAQQPAALPPVNSLREQTSVPAPTTTFVQSNSLQ